MVHNYGLLFEKHKTKTRKQFEFEIKDRHQQ